MKTGGTLTSNEWEGVAGDDERKCDTNQRIACKCFSTLSISGEYENAVNVVEEMLKNFDEVSPIHPYCLCNVLIICFGLHML